MRAEERGMSGSVQEVETLDQIGIDLEERFGFFRFTGKSARGEYAALMGSIERRRAVGVGFGENYLPVGNHAVHVIDRDANELFEQIKGLLVAELIEPVPSLVGIVNL